MTFISLQEKISSEGNETMIKITYSTVYGSSKTYAQHIAAALSLEAEDINTADTASADCLVIVGGLYAGSMIGLKKAISKLPEQAELVVVSVGIADPEKQTNAEKIDKDIYKSIPSDIQARTRVFHLRGCMDYMVMSPKHRAMMWMLCKYIKKKGPRNEEDQSILNTYGERIDFINLETAGPVIEYLKSRI